MKVMKSLFVALALITMVAMASRADNYHPWCDDKMDLMLDHCDEMKGNCCPN